MRIAALLCAAVVPFLVACDPATQPRSTPTQSPHTDAAFEFALLEWQCRHVSASAGDEVVRADGEFCFAALDVTNRGETAWTLEIPCQFMIEGEVRYTPHPAVMALDEAALAGFGQGIAPGETVKSSALYYDVPKGSHPDALELHEECEGPGFRLPLVPELRSDRIEADQADQVRLIDFGR